MIHTTLTRRDPFSLFDDVFRQVRAPLTSNGAADTGFTPAVDAHRDGDDLVAALDIPGVDPQQDVAVELSEGGRALTISGERKTRSESQGRREVRYGRFSRTVTLPEAVSQEAVSADYDAGVLTVRVTGVYAEEQARKIQITSHNSAAEIGTAEQGEPAQQ